MDSFNDQFHFDQHEELPEGFAWEDMKDDILAKMEEPKPKSNNPWPLLFLLFIGTCSGWMTYDRMVQKQELTTPIVTEQPTANHLPTSTHSLNRASADKTIVPTQAQAIPQSPNDQQLVTEKPSTNSTSPAQSTVASATTFTTNQLINKNSNFTTSITGQKEQPSEVLVSKATVPVAEQQREIRSAHASEALASLPALPLLPLTTITNSNGLPLVKPSPTTPSKSAKPNFKANYSWALLGGIQHWAFHDKNNPNTAYLSGYPGYAISPQISWQFAERRSLNLAYQYQALEELFDYEGTRITEKFLKNVRVSEVINSLTNARISEVRKDTFLQVSQYNKEIKYNRYQLHNLQLNFQQEIWGSAKSSLQLSTGVNWLLRVSGQGKRLDEERAVVAFQYGDDRFHQNRIALQLGLRYHYQISTKLHLIAQLRGQQYLSDWEKNPQLKSRPFTYGLSIGIGSRF